MPPVCSHGRRLGLAVSALIPLAGLLPIAGALAKADPLPATVRFDALYIPALSATSAAHTDARAVPRARAASARLHQAWPALRRALAAAPPGPAGAWARALQQVEVQLATAERSVARADWAQAHEDLEPVRITLLKARQAAGFDYFVDRLTAFHEPMEVLASAGATLAPGRIDARHRAELEKTFAEAAARWRAIEQHLPDARVYRLSPAREAQFRQNLAAEAAALSRLSDALRGGDDARLLAAAKAIKPPFARAFTAFGLAEGETLSD